MICVDGPEDGTEFTRYYDLCVGHVIEFNDFRRMRVEDHDNRPWTARYMVQPDGFAHFVCCYRYRLEWLYPEDFA